MAKWKFRPADDVTKSVGGVIQILFTKQGRAPQDLTYFRGAPVMINSYSSADPFGDATAEFSFPMVTPFDDFDGSDFVSWYSDTSDIDLWWIPAEISTSPSDELYINPLTGIQNLRLNYESPDCRKLWEGFVVSTALSNTGMTLQAQGALFQADGYLQKPFFPPRPVPLEDLLTSVWDHQDRPHLRSLPLRVDFPQGWAVIGPQYVGGDTVYTPNIQPGRKWTGYSSRSTGAWDRSVTGFAQDQLATMLTQTDSGVTAGNQWTVLQERENVTRTQRGRQPVLTIRDRFRPADFSMWVGTPGVDVSLTRDMTQFSNISYGEGTAVDGTVWRNAVISDDGLRTTYLPLAFNRSVYPPDPTNQSFDPKTFVRESYVKFSTGFDQKDAVQSAGKTLQRDMDPGWAGSISVQSDPVELPRWAIQAGMTICLKGFAGTGDTGMMFHIAEVSVDVQSGKVNLTVDNRYRDLLNLEDALSRARDSLTPSHLLQVNRASAKVEDIQAPWDYTAGSGVIPRGALAGFNAMPRDIFFPYTDWTTTHPPSRYPTWYVACKSNSVNRKDRWTQAVPILTSEKGTIRRTEIVCVDADGNPVKDKFHVSIYYNNVTVNSMPYDSNGPSPFITGAFETIDPSTGQAIIGSTLRPDDSIIIGWGNFQQPAGYSPGRYTDGTGATGQLVDESTWTFDNTSNKDYNKNAKPGVTQVDSAITIYAMFYSEHPTPVYFTGRLYKQTEGA